MLQRIILIFTIFTVIGTGYSQSSIDEIKLHGIDSSTLKYRIDTLTKEQFLNTTSNLNQERPDYNLKTHIDSLKLILKTSKETDSCIVINYGKKELKLCNKNGRDEKEGELYKLLDYKCGYVIALNGGYEWWNYLLIDPETGEFFVLRDQPIFIDCSYAYSYGNYYMEGQFILHDLIDNKKIEFDSFEWILEKCLRINNKLFFEFKSSGDSKTTKYLKIQFD